MSHEKCTNARYISFIERWNDKYSFVAKSKVRDTFSSVTWCNKIGYIVYIFYILIAQRKRCLPLDDSSWWSKPFALSPLDNRHMNERSEHHWLNSTRTQQRYGWKIFNCQTNISRDKSDFLVYQWHFAMVTVWLTMLLIFEMSFKNHIADLSWTLFKV